MIFLFALFAIEPLQLVPDHKNFQGNLRPDFSAQQSVESDGNLIQVVGQIPENFGGRVLEMTPQEKKKTGVFKLREHEKETLQLWIDNHYEKRSEPLVMAQTPQKVSKPSISENFNNGKFIRLSDDSLWEIRDQDRPITQSWITSVEIKIAPSQNPDYPYQLTNTLTGSSVLAKKASELPKSQPASP